MEVYILDDLLRRDQVIDRFISMIWTERYSAIGDFEMVMHSTHENRSTFRTGLRMAMNESHRVMIIETVEDTVDNDGEALLTIKGRSLELLLENRPARPNKDNLEVRPEWIITGPPANILRYMYNTVCVDGGVEAADIIPDVILGTFLPDDTIPEPADATRVEIEPTDLYSAMSDFAEQYGLGFRFLRHPETSQIYFDIYTGSNRTTSQNDLDPVIFAPELDNLRDTTALNSIAAEKNVAYVYSPVGMEIVYPIGSDPEVEGFDRRVLVVKTDIKTEDPVAATARMIDKGLEELAKHRSFSAFDGEIQMDAKHKYGVDYQLGDMIELRDIDGTVHTMRISEQIFVSDEEGERSYPTLSVGFFIQPGQWASWPKEEVWEDLGLEDYWATMP